MFLALGDAIASGAFPPGTRLPGELKLAEQFSVSRVTVRRAMAELERMGIVDRKPGVGTVVVDRAGIQPVVADFSNVLSHLLEMGRTTTVRLLDFDYGLPPEPVRIALRLPPDSRTQRSERVRLIDGEPFSYLTAFVPEVIGATYEREDLATTSLLALLERGGVEVDHAEQTVTASLSTPKTADALTIGVGEPLLAVTRTVFNPSGQGVEHLQALYRPNHYRLQIALNRVDAGGTRQWAPVAETSMTSDPKSAP